MSSDFLEAQGMDPVSAKEMTVWPGMELMSALFYLEEFSKDDSYEVVILDTAPTADTLRLLSFPETSDWYFDKLYKVFRNTVRIARLTVGKFMNTPLPSNEFLDDLDLIRDRMSHGQEDPHRPEHHLDPAGGEPGEDGDQRDEARVHLSLPLQPHRRVPGHQPSDTGGRNGIRTRRRSGRNRRSTWS